MYRTVTAEAAEFPLFENTTIIPGVMLAIQDRTNPGRGNWVTVTLEEAEDLAADLVRAVEKVRGKGNLKGSPGPG